MLYDPYSDFVLFNTSCHLILKFDYFYLNTTKNGIQIYNLYSRFEQ